MNSSIKNIVYVLPLEFPNDLKLPSLENQEIMEKIQKWVEAELSIYSTFEEKNFVTSGQKLHEKRYQISFLSCPILLDFLILFH